MTEQLGQLSDRLTEGATAVLERRSSRKSFLIRIAIAGSAMTVAPLRYLIRPESAWAVVTCSLCAPSDLCCGPNSTFCCTITGVNSCPSGSAPCGWWVCSTSGKHYIDCCSTSSCTCHCAKDDCHLRKTCCNSRFYFNCTGPSVVIVCRIISNSNPGLCYLCSNTGSSGSCDAIPSCAVSQC